MLVGEGYRTGNRESTELVLFFLDTGL
jgi:hypothetical protein